jgi:hypothetical protein
LDAPPAAGDVALEPARAAELPQDVSEAEVEESENKIMGVPLDTFVKYGTSTSAHDKMMAEAEADSKRRRAEADAEKRAAKEHGLAAGNPNSIASQYNHQFTPHNHIGKAYVPLKYVTRSGREVTHEGRADIVQVQDPAFPNELMLLLFCPPCIEKAGLPPAHAIIQIRQSNRRWELDLRGAGELIVDPEDGLAYRSAGTIRDMERFTCPRCSWKARIDDNKVWPD